MINDLSFSIVDGYIALNYFYKYKVRKIRYIFWILFFTVLAIIFIVGNAIPNMDLKTFYALGVFIIIPVISITGLIVLFIYRHGMILISILKSYSKSSSGLFGFRFVDAYILENGNIITIRNKKTLKTVRIDIDSIFLFKSKHNRLLFVFQNENNSPMVVSFNKKQSNQESYMKLNEFLKSANIKSTNKKR